MKELLRRLSEAHGAPGYEDEVSKIMHEELVEVCDEITRDKLGNVIAKKGSGKPVYMLTAHIDEIGFLVKHIDKKGYVWFITMGGFYDPTIFGTNVVIHTPNGKIQGVVGSRPIHLMKKEEREKVVEWKELFIDVGAANKKEAKMLGIEIGQPITIDKRMRTLTGNRVTGKAMDDRAGVTILIEIMKRLKNFKGTVYAVGSVQEEVGLKGAQVAAFRLRPDVALAIDVSFAGGPGIQPKETDIKMGNGPIISFAEYSGGGLIANPIVNKWLIGAAKTNKIPIQLEATYTGKTDAAAIYVTAEGIPSGSIGIPARYLHTPVEIVDLDDMELIVKLITAAVEEGIDI